MTLLYSLQTCQAATNKGALQPPLQSPRFVRRRSLFMCRSGADLSGRALKARGVFAQNRSFEGRAETAAVFVIEADPDLAVYGLITRLGQ